MNRAQAAAVLPIITAWAKGETIEFKKGDRWVDGGDLLNFLLPAHSYRIKPKASELWAVYEQNGTPVGHVKNYSDAQRLQRGKTGRYIKKFVEEQ